MRLVQVLNSVGFSLACINKEVYGSGSGSGTTASAGAGLPSAETSHNHQHLEGIASEDIAINVQVK